MHPKWKKFDHRTQESYSQQSRKPNTSTSSENAEKVWINQRDNKNSGKRRKQSAYNHITEARYQYQQFQHCYR